MNISIVPTLHQEATYVALVELTGGFRGNLNNPEDDNYCQFEVAFRNADGGLLEVRWIPFSEAELETWGDDDTVLVGLVLTKLGFTEAPPEEEPVPEAP
jgi:hypothetical protein